MAKMDLSGFQWKWDCWRFRRLTVEERGVRYRHFDGLVSSSQSPCTSFDI